MKKPTGTKAPRGNPAGHPPRRPRLKSLEDVRRYLASLVHETREGKVDAGLATKLGYLLNLLSGCIKDGDIEARLARLEEQARENP
ncbi:hypothetical protein dsat_1521 [Alkalidesulfovibrio alkalitolerans DSM 16529]|uniref:DUF5681 domain-containing protein n=1 Tax=Alkalidesulfovibrio alkalitolerans DSM 16529 TaxID=1121439 RepID=S7T1G3_9BACT|nr:hypothetical protein [Alkalidesulfovibrio alkalitolerans]EPR30381.1 hypothetical protein dsat_1521 [Alkalidesulfovibrio alkalitolerans DSM 16529]